MDIVISTENKHKLNEIKALFSDLNVTIKSLYDVLEDVPEIIEDGQTFEENAFKKIDWISPKQNTVYIADDSGLVVPALNGEPGIFSARYAGVGSTDSENCQKLLQEMDTIQNREAYFYCIIAVLLPDGRKMSFSGRVDGHITAYITGENGFGYDPLFIPKGYDKTFSCLPAEIKNSCSHRFKALDSFKKHFNP